LLFGHCLQFSGWVFISRVATEVFC
jgi:hypothetical protein